MSFPCGQCGPSAGDRCGRWEWSACITAKPTEDRGGALFLDLPANSLGCLVVGLLSSSSTLNLAAKKNVAMLGESHWLQKAKAVQTGLRTGFCGCLTSYASWCAAARHMFPLPRGCSGHSDKAAVLASWWRVSRLHLQLNSKAKCRAVSHSWSLKVPRVACTCAAALSATQRTAHRVQDDAGLHADVRRAPERPHTH